MLILGVSSLSNIKTKYFGKLTVQWSDVRDQPNKFEHSINCLHFLCFFEKHYDGNLFCFEFISGKKLSDGKCLSGQGRLTIARIDAMQCFYGMALRSNAGDTEAMSKATLAILNHYKSDADHTVCPKGN